MKTYFTLFLTLQLGALLCQSFAWQKQFRNFGVSNLKNTSISTNSVGDIVTTGSGQGGASTSFVDFNPSSAGTYTVASTYNLYNVWVSRLDKDGNFVWATKFDVDAGMSQDYIRTKIDNNGNVYITGIYKGVSDFDPGPGTYTMSTTNNGGSYNANAFIAKLNANGTFAWVKEFRQLNTSGGAALIEDIALDQANNLVLTGFYDRVDLDPSPTNNLNMTNKGAFLVKLNGNGDLQFAKTLPDVGGLYPLTTALTIDHNDQIVLLGKFGGTYDFDPSASATYTLSAGVSGSSFMLKLDANGNFVWVKGIQDNIPAHTNAGGFASDIACDAQNNVYVCGQTKDSLDFDPGSNTYYLKAKGSTDIYVAKLDAAGNFVWAKMFGGTNIESANALTVDTRNHVYIETQFQSTDIDFDPSASMSYTVQKTASPSMAVNELDGNGDFVTIHYFKSNDSNANTSIEDLEYNAYTNELFMSGQYRTTGSFYNVDFDPGTTVSTSQSASPSLDDVFVVKLSVPASTTSLSESLPASQNLLVFPNPSTGKVSVRHNPESVLSGNELVQLCISDISGRCLKQLYSQGTETSIDLSDLVKGLYILTLSTDRHRVSRTIIIE